MTLYEKAPMVAREQTIAAKLPYTVQLDEATLRGRNRDLLRIIRIEGVAHESADDEDLNAWINGLNILLRNIASPEVALWTHTVRREESHYPDAHFEPGFAADLNQHYREHLTRGARMLVNELYLTIIYRPATNPAGGLLRKLADALTPPSFDQAIDELENHMRKMDDLTQQVFAALDRYEPRLLRTHEHNGATFSEPLEFLAFLINGQQEPMPLPRRSISDMLGTARLFFGPDAVEQRGLLGKRLSGFLSIKEYPAQTHPGLLNGLLSAPFEFVLTQSFTFMSKPAASGLLSRTRDRMVSAGDLAESQIQEINDALDDLTSNRFVYGQHHLSLAVTSPTLKQLGEDLSLARSIMADVGMVITREDLAIEAAFWAQLPANYAFRPRLSPITSRNFAGFASMHNYPMGQATGNHWGEAVALLRTASGGPYYFNFHRGDLGHTTIIGPSGSGKTVTQGFLIAMLEKFSPALVFFDKDHGAEIFIRAQRGRYLSLENGVPTGFNPFQRPCTPDYESFLQALIKKLVTPNGEAYTVRDEADVASAIRGVYQLDPQMRRLSQVLSFLDPTDGLGIHARLAKWCRGGTLAWVFDNEADEVDFTRTRLNGFDITAFLDNAETRTPIIMYLFRRATELFDGRRVAIFIDEFWKALLDEYFEDLVLNGLKTWRKLNGFLVTGTQSISDTLQSPISKTIIEQSPTKIFMPNEKADRDDYIGGFKLTEREFDIVRSLGETSRRFLVKQGNNSVVASLNLRGFDDELAVLSGTAANVRLAHEVIAELGEDPDRWLPEFHRRRLAA